MQKNDAAPAEVSPGAAAPLTAVKCLDYGRGEAPFGLRRRVRKALREAGRPALAQAFWSASESCAEQHATLREVARRFVILQAAPESAALEPELMAWLRQSRERLPDEHPVMLQIISGRIGLRVKDTLFVQQEAAIRPAELLAMDDGALRGRVLEPIAALLGRALGADLQVIREADGAIMMVMAQLLAAEADHA